MSSLRGKVGQNGRRLISLIDLPCYVMLAPSAKGDKLLRRQAAIVAELERFRHAGRDALGPEHSRERQQLARQLRFQAGMPRPIACGGGSIVMARGR